MDIRLSSINPLKTSPGLGAAYAIQGVKGALALFHAAPGCTFIGKVLLTQHLKEPVGLLGTDIKEIPTIMGGCDVLRKKVIEISEKINPSLIGIIGTPLSEVRGEDVKGTISGLSGLNPEIIYIPAPDYIGGFSEGYEKAVEAVLLKIPEPGDMILGQVNILPSPSMTIGDVDELKDIVSAFGLTPIILPDLSVSMDGSKDRYSTLPLDGTTIDGIKLMGRSSAAIAIGEGMKKAGEILRDRFNIPLHTTPIPLGLEANDKLIKLLMEISGRGPTDEIKRRRKRLVDAMVDTHLVLADKKVAAGIDKDLCSAVTGLCLEMGMKITGQDFKDLEDLEDASAGVDMLIANSHGKETAQRLGVPLLRMGFPVYDRFGETLKVRTGYRGTQNLIFEMANVFIENNKE